MGQVLVLSQESESKIYRYLIQNSKFDVSLVHNAKDMILSLLESPMTNMLVIESISFDVSLVEICEKINILNPLLSISILRDSVSVGEEKNFTLYNVTFISNDENDKLLSLLNKNTSNRRQHNRVKWPLFVKYSLSREMQPLHVGDAISFSAGGTYVRSEHVKDLEVNKMLYMKIVFQDFSFFAEASIVTVNKHKTDHFPKGFSVQFVDVSNATSNAINRIVNDRLFSDLFHGLI